MSARLWPGRPYPLGAHFDGIGVNFALFSENATRIELCLFDAPDTAESERVELRHRTGHVFHGYLPNLLPGQLYGYRVHGPFAPQEGHRFDPARLVLDPYAHAVANEIDWTTMREPARPDPKRRTPGTRDNSPGAPKGVVVDPYYDWRGDRHPRTPWSDTVIYEVHVKGMTAQHPDVPESLRGTYLGMASAPVIDHLERLGVTAVELLPVHEIADEPALIARGLRNYWGYNTLGFFAPAGRYATGRRGEQVTEFRQMVSALHAAGIEVILDVVYNHTCEGGADGPTLSLRGIDNRSYYRLLASDLRQYVDYTGCGNSLNMLHPQTLKLIMDSLRYWVLDMHVDGFRFDLAPALARELHDVDRLSAFFDIIHQDPVLSRTKLIAEPWDVGAGGYQVGNFPVLWSEWNGKYRDAVRRFWKGDAGVLGEVAFRLSGSSDLYQDDGRQPFASINYVTAHDGFTLADIVSYNHKHNAANGENNRDGSDHNDSWNHGVEGPTDDPAVRDMRDRTMRNLLVTLTVSQGVPMLSAGDELARSQTGNNNAYCQDNAISWLDWRLDEHAQRWLAYTVALLSLRRNQPVLRRASFFAGERNTESPYKDLVWLRPDGREMSAHDWTRAQLHGIAMLLSGDAIPDVGPFGEAVRGDTLLVLLNAGDSPVDFVLPTALREQWELLLHTTGWEVAASGKSLGTHDRHFLVGARAIAVLRRGDTPASTGM